MKIIFYQTRKKDVPVQKFINSLDVKDKAKILACLKSIEDLGFRSPRVRFRQIKEKLWEIKIQGKVGGYRIFYVVVQCERLMLLHAYKKQSQKAPLKEIAIAEKRLMEVLSDDSHNLK